MTLIVGVLCEDGVVMGADGAATLSNVQELTVKQPVKKISILANQIVMGTSGPVGMGQRLRWVAKKLWEDKKFMSEDHSKPQDPEQVMVTLREGFWPHLGREIEQAKVAGQIARGAVQSAISTTLVAMPVKGKPCLFLFDNPQGAPEMAQGGIVFYTIGLGQKIADPFLAFLKRIFWSDRLPTLAEGRLATVWTLDHAIETAPAGIAKPVQLVVLGKSKVGWEAKELSKEELEEHRQNIRGAEDDLRKYMESFQSEEGITPPPKPDKPEK